MKERLTVQFHQSPRFLISTNNTIHYTNNSIKKRKQSLYRSNQFMHTQPLEWSTTTITKYLNNLIITKVSWCGRQQVSRCVVNFFWHKTIGQYHKSHALDIAVYALLNRRTNLFWGHHVLLQRRFSSHVNSNWTPNFISNNKGSFRVQRPC